MTVYTLTALGVAEVFVFTGGTAAAAAAVAIFAARRRALLLVRGVMAGACTLLGRGLGLAGVAAPLVDGRVVTPADVDGREADVDVDRREAVLTAEGCETTREGVGRDAGIWTEATEAGRETETRLLGGLYEVREEDLDGV